MRHRLQIDQTKDYWSEELNLEELAWYNFENKAKVRYVVRSKYVDPSLDRNYFTYDSCLEIVRVLDSWHESFFRRMLMDKEGSKRYFEGYNLNYEDQQKGGKKL